MIFAWDEINIEHLAKHGVSPAEAEELVRSPEPPYPMEIGEEKLIVWGETRFKRLLQVIYVFKVPDEVEYRSLRAEAWSAIESGDETRVVRVIHGMDLTAAMKKRWHKRRK